MTTADGAAVALGGRVGRGSLHVVFVATVSASASCISSVVVCSTRVGAFAAGGGAWCDEHVRDLWPRPPQMEQRCGRLTRPGTGRSSLPFMDETEEARETWTISVVSSHAATSVACERGGRPDPLLAALP